MNAEAFDWVVPAEGVTKSQSSCGSNDCAFSKFQHLILMAVFSSGWPFLKKECRSGVWLQSSWSAVNHGLVRAFFSLLLLGLVAGGEKGLCPCSCASLRPGAAKVAGACFIKLGLFNFFVLFCLARALIRSGFIFISIIFWSNQPAQRKNFFEKSYFRSGFYGFCSWFWSEQRIFCCVEPNFFTWSLGKAKCSVVFDANLELFSVGLQLTVQRLLLLLQQQ